MSLEPSYCGYCGTYLPSGENFCTACGHKRIIPSSISSQSNQMFNQPSYGKSPNFSYPYNQPVNNQSSYNRFPYDQWANPSSNPYGETYNNQSINPFIGILVFISTLIFPFVPIVSLVMFFYYWRKNMLRAAKQVFNITLIAVFFSIFISIALQVFFPELFQSSSGP